jgi:hypothetical protein
MNLIVITLPRSRLCQHVWLKVRVGGIGWLDVQPGAGGQLEANGLGVNSFDNFSAKPNADGSYTIRFGGCDDALRRPGGGPHVLEYSPAEYEQAYCRLNEAQVMAAWLNGLVR